MGCESSRAYPKSSPEWAIRKVRKHYGFKQLEVQAILDLFPPMKNSYLHQIAINELAQKLHVRVPNDLVREGARDLRVSQKKLLFTLIVLANDSSSMKAEVLAQLMDFRGRDAMLFLEWRFELLYSRMVDRAVNDGLLTLSEAKTYHQSHSPETGQSLIQEYDRIDLKHVPDSLHQIGLLDLKF